MRKAVVWFILLQCLTGLLIGCSPVNSSTVEVPPDRSLASNTNAMQAEPEAEATLQRFADVFTSGDTQGVMRLLSPALMVVYEFQDYAPIRNTPGMEILKMVDVTGDWPADPSGVDTANIAETRVYYLQVRYKVLGIIQSVYVDGEIFHHKATVLRKMDGSWLISELSATRPPQ